MNLEDYNALYQVLADSDIMQHYPYTFDEQRVRGWINRNIERYHIRKDMQQKINYLPVTAFVKFANVHGKGV